MPRSCFIPPKALASRCFYFKWQSNSRKNCFAVESVHSTFSLAAVTEVLFLSEAEQVWTPCFCHKLSGFSSRQSSVCQGRDLAVLVLRLTTGRDDYWLSQTSLPTSYVSHACQRFLCWSVIGDRRDSLWRSNLGNVSPCFSIWKTRLGGPFLEYPAGYLDIWQMWRNVEMKMCQISWETWS